MTAANIQITAGSGTRLATNSYTEGAVTVHDEKFIPGEYPYPTYSVSASGVSLATSSDHFLTINAGASLNVRIRRIHFEQTANVTTAAELTIIVLRTTTGAPSGGTAITPAKFVTTDGASGATAMTIPSTKGTESTELFRRRVYLTQTVGTGGAQANQWEWVQLPNEEPITIAAGTTNGIALKISTGRAAATGDCQMTFIETSW